MATIAAERQPGEGEARRQFVEQSFHLSRPVGSVSRGVIAVPDVDVRPQPRRAVHPRQQDQRSPVAHSEDP